MSNCQTSSKDKLTKLEAKRIICDTIEARISKNKKEIEDYNKVGIDYKMGSVWIQKLSNLKTEICCDIDDYEVKE